MKINDTGPGAKPPLGPFETEQEALGSPAVRAIYGAMRASSRRGVMAEQGHRLLEEACEAAGVEVGAYDHKIIVWLAGFEPQASAVITGLITRARPSALPDAADMDTIRQALADAVAYRALTALCAGCSATPEGCADHRGDAERAAAYETALRHLVTGREVF